MPKQLPSYQDSFGNTYSASFWIIDQINISIWLRRCTFTFICFRDQDAYATGKSPIAGAVKSYTVEGSDFASMYARHMAGERLDTILYDWADSCEDTLLSASSDDAGNIVETYGSFFASASDVAPI